MAVQIKADLIDYMGNDDSVANAARVSFAKDASNFTPSQNNRLIQFLAREKHELPFAHTAVTLRCSAPLPQRTHAFKSKVGFVENEESRRYISTTPEIFVPDEFRSAVKDKKQGSGGRHPHSDEWLRRYKYVTTDAVEAYEQAIQNGVCAEQARYFLPQGAMVNWIWTGSLLAYARFYNLRSKPDTQKETQDLAHEVGLIVSKLYPVSWDALTNAVELKAA